MKKTDKRWTTAQLKQLGSMPDGEVARRTKRTRNAVAIKRVRCGIDAYEQQLGYEWEDWEVALLGTMSDYEAADVLGVSRRTVVRERKKRGVAAFKKTG